MKAARSIFNFSPPLHLKQDKTLGLFTSLIQIDWLHSWPQGASSHCSFLCCECTFRIALYTLSWLTCWWEVALLFSRHHEFMCSLIPLAVHDCLIEPWSGFYLACWYTYSSLCSLCGPGERSWMICRPLCSFHYRLWKLFCSFRPHSWVYRSLIIRNQPILHPHVPSQLSVDIKTLKSLFNFSVTLHWIISDILSI